MNAPSTNPSLVPTVLCLILLASGCTSQRLPEGMPRLIPLTLSFVQQDKPLAEAVVSLVPEDPESRWSAGGTTDANGRLLPKTMGRYAGVAPGRYKVVVYKQEIDLTSEKTQLKDKIELHDVYYLVDPRFGDSGTTPLVLDTDQGGKSVSFDVGDSVRIKAVHTFP